MDLKREIKQTRPFVSTQEELVLSLMRTADIVAVRVNDALRSEGLSSSQYNVLRILRGAGDEALPCGEISERMVRRDPDLTRLLDRLEKRALVERTRGVADRRVVLASITREGLELLASLDEPMEASLKEALRGMTAARMRTLIELLDEVRELAGRSHK